MSEITKAAQDVADERKKQDAKWGEQNHPDGTGPGTLPLEFLDDYGVREVFVLARPLARIATDRTNSNAEASHVTWKDILLEEVFEALAEEVPWMLRAELVQVAAVAQQWVETIDRREAEAVSA